MLQIGIISFAHMHAYSYADAIRQLPGVTLVCIADEDEARGRAAAEQFGAEWTSDYRELLSRPLDAVIVTSENVRHCEHVLAAAEAGKHVLCEKPLATNEADGLRMIEACRNHGVRLQTAFPVRFVSPVIAAKRAVERGEIGTLLAAKGTNRGKFPSGWFTDPALSGGGALLDHTVHVTDLLRWISGMEVREVYAEAGYGKFADTQIDDCGLLTLTFDNGMFATIDCSWSRNENYPTWGDITLELIGTKGSLTLDAFAQQVRVFEAKGEQWLSWGDNMDLELIRDFTDSLRIGREPSVTGEDGLQAARVAFAAYESVHKGGPIPLKEVAKQIEGAKQHERKEETAE
ncbi:Gfo/Idh/MocA family protein [Paenibacillus hexagrammi]|uniref:Gfo/Idh/MocA family oxidoreductase n=1 Tax=Paenibacillus hexagrammi TaxID=2908839 RepID=A0ABY3SJJ9_9BACL|nr:Gfo/Idh/MocA family oxidoreductase [Paenibacillus sp. YPD9-1]UJF33993.1 Gfo/Idh/MocA family oxidoreductase [Paenibacillus sp. YPD9-1]